MMKLISFILLFFYVYSTTVSAKEYTGTPNQIFKPVSKVHVEILLKRGITKIGKLDLKKLSKQLSTVEWRTFEVGFLIGSGGNRYTSVYVVKDRMVIINLLSFENLQNQPVHLFSWALHEGLGALGYNDENYEISSSISFLAENPQLGINSGIEYIEEHFQVIAKTKTDRRYAMSGGSTVVGGGGDAIIIEFKQLLLKRYFEWIKINNPELSNEEIKKGFNSLIKFKMETYFLDNSERMNMSFWLDGQTFYLGQGAQYILAQVYKVESLDLILDALKEYL